MSTAPDWTTFAPRDLVNVKTGRPYRLVRGDSVAATDERVAEIVAICNEPAVYDFLFRERWDGVAYIADDARRFLAWIADGRARGTHFVFFVLDATGAVVACADVKSADVDGAEVGYWASSAHAGVMTPAVAALTDAARAAGYRRLYATTRPENERSQAVLLRNGFVRRADDVQKPTGVRRLFERTL